MLLCRDNKLPFIKITKAEYLDKLAGAIERKYAKKKEQAVKSWAEGNVYDFVFNPDKVHGQPYEPLRAPVAKQR